MKRLIVVLGAFLCLSFPAKAQEFFVEADLVSKYMWRGIDCGNAAIQPAVGFEVGGFSISAWASIEFKHKNNELDLTLSYTYKNLTLSLNDVYVQNDDENSNYFKYSPRTTGHSFDAGISYIVSEKVPLSLTWYTYIAGNDYKENDKRAYSTYIELSYPFSIKGVDFESEIGITPWEGTYADKLNVVNMALTTTKEFRITERFAIPVFAQIGYNPYLEKTYIVGGVRFQY